MASRKAAVSSLPSLLLIGALLLVVMASPGAFAEEGAASSQFPSPDRATPTPEPSPKNSRAVRAGSPAVSSLGGGLPSAPAPQPHPRRE